MIIVCDSSPLFAMAICDKLHLLEQMYDTVLIPEAVYDEVSVSGKPNADKIQQWAHNKIASIKDDKFIHELAEILDMGEAEAIALYKVKNADYLLIDERKGRKIAESYNIKIIGTLGLLLLAKQKGFLESVKPCIELLQQSTIRIAPELFQMTLQRAGEDCMFFGFKRKRTN
jgi:predicted nucleic acid-binding protein